MLHAQPKTIKHLQ